MWSERALNQAAGSFADDPDGLTRLLDAVDLLANEPRPVGTAEYGSPDVRRLHVGRYRVRCPAGSHDTVTPANPLAAARSAAQSNATPKSHARHRNVLRANTLESWSHTTTICLLSAKSIPTIALSTGTSTRSRASRALRFRSPLDTSLPLTTNVLLSAMGHQALKRTRRTFPRPDRHAERLSMPS